MTKPTPFLRRPMLFAAAAGIAAGVALAAFYGISGGARNRQDAACAASAEQLAGLKPLARGEVAALAVADRGRMLPELTFTDRDGQPRTLADFKGKTVLLNLWATWCAPCREEMPALDRLQAELGGNDFDVVAVSIDSDGPEKPLAFLDEIGVTRLVFYADPSGGFFRTLRSVGRAPGLPVSLLVDEAGCEIGYLPGPADWASKDALTLLRQAMQGATIAK